MHTLINRKAARLHLPRRQVLPSPGELVLDCGDCGGRVFDVFVRTDETGARARASSLVCVECRNVRRVEPDGLIAGDGKVTVPGLKG